MRISRGGAETRRRIFGNDGEFDVDFVQARFARQQPSSADSASPRDNKTYQLTDQ